MSETLFPVIDKQFLTAKQIEETAKLKKGTLRQIVNRNKELTVLPYSEIKIIKGKDTRIYYEPIIKWLSEYFKDKDPLQCNSYNVTGENRMKIILTASLLKEMKASFTPEEIRLILINEGKLNYLNAIQAQNVTSDTPKPIDKPKTKDKPLTRRQALHSLIIHYADAKGVSYNSMYSRLYTEYFGYSGYYSLSQQYKNLMDYIEDHNQLDNFAEFIRSKLSE